jgi:2-keto-3-deoxy-L-rhamnonate aldolase RhmA
MKRISAKEKLKAQGFLLGSFAEIGAPGLVEIFGLTGFDCVVIDCEHAAFSGEAVGAMVRAAEATGTAPLVRVRENAAGNILEALDLGAVGLHIPQISSPEDAQRAVRAARFPPQGARGFNPFVRAAGYGTDAVDAFRKTANDDTLLVLHLEAEDSLDQVEDIVAVPGIDVAFIGPYDLSQTMGIPGQVTHPKVREAMRAAVRAAAKHNVSVGCFASSIEQASLWLNEGVSYLIYSVDSLIFVDSCRAIRREVDQRRIRSS